MGWLYHDATERGGGYEGYHSYDLAGNLLAFRSPTPPPAAPGSTVNANDQLLFGRDASGQVGQIWWRPDGTPSVYKSPDPVNAPQVQFDPDQHLLSGIGTASHGYRGDGLRAWREVNGQRTWSVYDGLTPICELDAEGNLVTSRTYGRTGPVARGEVYYLYDLLGDVAVRHTLGNDELSADVYDARGVRLAGAIAGRRGMSGMPKRGCICCRGVGMTRRPGGS